METARKETDWARIDAMTDEELTANALSDPDNPPLGEGEFASLPPAVNVAAIRMSLGLSQTEFAAMFRLPLEALDDWEQGRSAPDATQAAYLTVIARDPDAVRRALLTEPAL